MLKQTLILLLVISFTPWLHAEPLADIHNFHAIHPELLTAGQVKSEHIQALVDENIEFVINLAPASEDRNRDEGFLVTREGISYTQIPVKWDEPTDQDLQLFFAMMAARGDRRTLVHCFANYRASAFTYLYRVLQLGVEEPVARQALNQVWDDEAFEHAPQWRRFIDRHLADGKRID